MVDLAFIGGGNMAEALIKGITSGRAGAYRITVAEPGEEKRLHLEKKYGVKATSSNMEAVRAARTVLLAVKPQIMEGVLGEIKDGITADHTVISIAAGVRLSFLGARLGTKKLIRVMPNTPALAGEGMTVISLCECLEDAVITVVKDIFMSVGNVSVMPEKYMDAVTALSGSGPAFFALFIEGLVEGAVRAGLAEQDARLLALQTAAGTLKMLENGMDTQNLRRMVTSPGGTTEAGLKVLEGKGFKQALYDTIDAAARRAAELGKG